MAEEEKITPEEVKKPTPVGKFFHQYGYLVITALTVLVLFRGVFNLAYVPTSSMEPTLPVKSLFLSLRLPWLAADPEPEQGDIMMFYSQEYDQIMVKRVIGLPGETIQIKDGMIYIDGEVYLEKKSYPVITNPGMASDGITLGNQEYFVLGDNRNNSVDSRFADVGTVKASYIEGKVWFVLSPSEHRGLVK